MKKVVKTLLLSLFCFIVLNSFAQLKSIALTSSVVPHGTPTHAPLGAIVQPNNSVFTYMPVGSDNAYTSYAPDGYKCYQSFSGATGSFNMVTIWGVTDAATALPLEFTVELFAPGGSAPAPDLPLGTPLGGAGPGIGPGSLINTETLTVTPELTGVTASFGYVIYCYHIPITSSSLTNGWISVQATASSPTTFYWLDTYSTPVYKAYQNSTDLQSYGGFGLSMCLSNSNSVPVSTWAVLLGFVLIAGAVTFRFWRRIV